jgi:hypothetical protein
MKSDLKQKLSCYTALASVLSVFSSTKASAQFVHTTVDYKGGYETYDIDIDNDGIVDFTINANQQSYAFTYNSMPITIEVGYVNLAGNLVNQFAGGVGVASSQGFTYPYNYALNLNVGVVVNSIDFSTFVSSGALAGKVEAITTFNGFPVTVGGFDFGKFGDGEEYFVGVKFEIGSSLHYGWLRFKDVRQNGSKWTLVDMAYNTIEGEEIVTGQTLSVKENNPNTNIIVDADNINIITDGTLINAKVDVVNMLGQTVANTLITSNHSSIKKSFDSGIYVVRIIDEKGKVISKKIKI